MKRKFVKLLDNVLQVTALALATPGAVLDVYRAMQLAKKFNQNQINPTLH